MAGQADEGRSVKDILKTRFGLVDHDISRAKYRKDGIRVNGARTYVTTLLEAGDVLTVRIDDEPAKEVAAGEGPLDILYEDEDLLAVNKPAGVVVHPSHGHYADSLGNDVAGYFLRHGETHDIRTIGRLDKDTSGIMLYGKTRSAVYLLNEQSRKGLFKKTYLALVSGQLTQKAGTFDGPIGRVPGEKLLREVRPDGDTAVTHYEVIAEFRVSSGEPVIAESGTPVGEPVIAESGATGGEPVLSLVRVWLETGRTHQIRVHFSHAGHPLAGDRLYGGPELMPEERSGAMPRPIDRACLHCYEVSFIKPFSDERIRFRAPLPDDMVSVIPDEVMKEI